MSGHVSPPRTAPIARVNARGPVPPAGDGYRRLLEIERRLSQINAGQDPSGARLLRLIADGARVTIHAEEVQFQRVGARLRVTAKTNIPELGSWLDLLTRVLEIGLERIRQCKLEGCGNWFIAHKDQRYCTLAHGNRGSYLAWKERQKGKERRRKGK